MPCVVGLTGGIGCGKSKAADYFSALGADVVDTDAISHALTGPGDGAMKAIEGAFGPSYGRSALDRARMKTRVFADPAKKARPAGGTRKTFISGGFWCDTPATAMG